MSEKELLQNLFDRINEIIDDEHEECVHKYPQLHRDLLAANIAEGEIVLAINADECRHEQYYRQLLDVVRRKLYQ